MTRMRVAALLVGAVATGGCASQGAGSEMAAAPAAPVTGAYVTKLGNDTVAVERFSRTADRLEGDLAIRAGGLRVTHYVMHLGPDGTIRRVETATRPGIGSPDAVPTLSQVVTWTGDTVVTEQKRGDSTRVVRAAVRPGTVLYLPYGYGPYQLAISRLATPSDSVLMHPVATQTVWPIRMRRIAGDSVQVETFNGTIFGRVDARGHFRRMQTVGGTFTLAAESMPYERFPVIIAALAEKERAAGILRQLSSRDSVRAVIGGRANVAIDYHRPSKRGRLIFGGLVPFDSVWRTGANNATSFRTDTDLMIGDTRVPAGSYTLWSIPSRTGWTLIVNKQIGQWGTIYNREQDLARIPMQTRTAPEPREQFTMTIEPDGAGAVLRLAWDDREAWVPIRIP